MGVNLFNVPKRVTQNEMTANISRKKNGYKISNKTRTRLGIPAESAAKLAIGEDQGNLWVKCVEEDAPHNAHVSKLNMINSNGIVSMLDKYGNHFEITDETNEEGYHKMIAETKESNNTESTDTENTDREYIEGQTPVDALDIDDAEFAESEEDDFA